MKAYTIEYQTEPDAVKEFHRTSVKFLIGLIVCACMLYLFH